METKGDRQGVFAYVLQAYGTSPEYPWGDMPAAAVLRRNEDRKWYGVVMAVSREKLGLPGPGTVDILNVKLEPELITLLLGEKGYFPAYHMNKTHWITLLLDGSLSLGEIGPWLERSYHLTARRKPRPAPVQKEDV